MIPSLALMRQRKSRLMRWCITAAVLCALPVLGFLTVKITPRISPVFVLVALALPVGVLTIAWKAELGIVAAIVAAVFIRFRIPTGTESEIVISMVICGGGIALWVVRMLVEERRLSIKPAATNVPLLGFMVTVAVSWLWSRAFRDALVQELGHPLSLVAAGMVMILLPGCLLWMSNNVRNIRWLQTLVGILLFEGLVVLIIDLGQAWGLAVVQSISTLLFSNSVIWLNSHGLLSMWCMSFALALAFFNRRLSWVWRALLLIYAAGWVYWGFVLRTSWLTGWMPAFASAAVIAFMRSKKLFVVVLIVVIAGAGGYYWRTAFGAERQESGLTRLYAYEVNWRVTSKHLLFGTGPAEYASYYTAYFPSEAMATHSTYVDTLAQTGVVGSIFFLWFFGAQLWKGYRMGRQLRGHGDLAESLSNAVLGGTAGCVIAMALGDWLLPFAYTQGIVGFDMAVINWLFMGSIWALYYILVPNAGSRSAHSAERVAA